MRKIIFFSLLAMFLGQASLRAQVIGSSNLSEVFFPPLILPASPISNMTNHVACYDLVNPNGGSDRYSVWVSNFAYNNTGSPTNTLAWRHEDAFTGALIAEGHINDIAVPAPGQHAIELEPAVFVENGDVYVLVAYYSCYNNSGWFGSGHYYNIYRWDPTGLTLISINPLSNIPRYTRISVDAFKSYALAITWSDSSGIKIKTWHSNYVVPWSPTLTIQNTQGGELPDVAISFGPSGWVVRVAYIQTQIIRVWHQDINAIQTAGGPTIPFIFDDAWLTSYYYVGGSNPMYYGNYKSDFARAYFHVAGPVQATDDLTWSVVYNEQPTSVKARICANGVSNTVNLTTLFTFPAVFNNYRKEFPTLSYQSDQGYSPAIYFGFCVLNNSAIDQYVAVKTDIQGFPIVNGYMQVTNPAMATPVGNYSGIAFPKFTMICPDLFVTFTGQETASTDTLLITKKIPWADTHFKPTGIEESVINGQTAEVYPNPFANHFKFGGSIDLDKKYSITITDITGRNVLHTESTLQQMNNDGSVYQSLQPGIFLLHISSGKDSQVQQTLKLVKR